MIPRSVGKRVLLLVACASLCRSAAACGREEASIEEEPAIELSFMRSTTYIEVADTVSLGLSHTGSLSSVLDSIQWSSDDTTVVGVHTVGGVVTGVSEGATRVWARLGTDSVSTIVVVEARTAMFALSPRDIFFDAVGGFADLDLLSIGRDPLPDGDLAPYCSSTNGAVVSVQPGPTISSVGNGTAFIRCEIAGTIDSVLVRVRQRAVRIAILEAQVRPIGTERDSVIMDIATIDRLGSPIFDVTPTWRSLNARIVQIDRDAGVALGVSVGSARIVAEYEGLADTLRLEVTGAAAAEAVSGLAPATVIGLEREFTPEDETELETDFFFDEFAEADVADMPVARAGTTLPLEDERITQIIGAQDSSSEAGEQAGHPVVFVAVAGLADHRVDIGSGTEKTSGPVFGAEFDLPVAARLLLHGQFVTGKLSAGASGIEDRTLTDLGGTVGYGAIPWGVLEIGANVRSYSTTLSTQRWSSISTGGRAYLDALDGLVRGHVNFAFLPLVSVTGIQSPSLGLQAGAGLNLRQGRFIAGLRYELERFSFPARLGVQRVEQSTVLRFRVGLALGGN
jgi:hypothetical protein